MSWLAPRKVREMMVVGSHRMVQYDDTATDEAVRVFDRGMEFSPPKTFGEYQLTYRSGDMIVPRLEPAEPLSLELADFAQRDPHRHRAALELPARARDRARDGGRRGVAAPQRPADRGHQLSGPHRRLTRRGPEPSLGASKLAQRFARRLLLIFALLSFALLSVEAPG